jgi:hypothetical protein
MTITITIDNTTYKIPDRFLESVENVLSEVRGTMGCIAVITDSEDEKIKTDVDLGINYISQIGRKILKPQKMYMGCGDTYTIAAVNTGVLQSVTFDKNGCTLVMEDNI